MSSNMYPYTRPTEGGTLAVSENGVVDLAGTNYSKINVNVSGGSGGSVGSVGIAAGVSGTPTVGSVGAESECIVEARLGDKIVTTAMDTPLNTMFFAAGLTLTTAPIPDGEVVCTAYVVTLDSNGRYATVEEWDGTLTKREVTVDGNQMWVWDFVMPELAEGEAIDLYLHT